MKPLTYRELKAKLNKLTEEQLDMSVTMYDTDNHQALPIMDIMPVSELDNEDAMAWMKINP